MKKQMLLMTFMLFVFLISACFEKNEDLPKKMSSPEETSREITGQQKVVPSFESLLKKENAEDLRLTIYYRVPGILFRKPQTVEDLVYLSTDEQRVRKIVVEGVALKECRLVFDELIKTELRLVEKESTLDAMIYYIIENSENRKLFDVAMWGENSIYVNDIEVEKEDIFNRIILPFLPEEIKDYYFEGRQE